MSQEAFILAKPRGKSEAWKPKIFKASPVRWKSPAGPEVEEIMRELKDQLVRQAGVE